MIQYLAKVGKLLCQEGNLKITEKVENNITVVVKIKQQSRSERHRTNPLVTRLMT